MEVQRKYGVATTLLFPLITRGSLDFKVGGITFVAADTQISKNEAAFANTGSVPTHEGNGIFSLVLTATEMQAARIAMTCIDATTKLWEDQAIIIVTYGHISAQYIAEDKTAGIIRGAAITGTLTTTEMTTDLTEASNNHYNGQTLGFLSGNLDGQKTNVTAYLGSTKKLTFTTLTEAPANGDLFELV